jgi:hypothetical protein
MERFERKGPIYSIVLLCLHFVADCWWSNKWPKHVAECNRSECSKVRVLCFCEDRTADNSKIFPVNLAIYEIM